MRTIERERRHGCDGDVRCTFCKTMHVRALLARDHSLREARFVRSDLVLVPVCF